MDGEEHSDDPDDLDDERDHREEDREETAESVTIEITGLSLYTHHGGSEAEREGGPRLGCRPAPGRGRNRRHRDGLDRGHDRLRRGVPAGGADRAAALAQDA